MVAELKATRDILATSLKGLPPKEKGKVAEAKIAAQTNLPILTALLFPEDEVG